MTLGDSRGIGRPSVVESFRPQLGALLQADPRMKTIEILQRMRQAGYAGGKSALYEMVRSLRTRNVSPLGALENLPGVLSQHDFGAVVITYPAGRRERIRFFASRLKYSRYLDVRLIRDDGIEALIRSLLAGFEAFGGVPLVAVFDNARTVTLGREGKRIEWDETFGQVAIDYRFAPELRTLGGDQKRGSAEDVVGLVKANFFKMRRFKDRADILLQLADWNLEVNTARPCRATGVTPHSRLAAERERLRPIAISPSEYALRFPVVVGPTGIVEFQGHRYTMPREAIGIPCLLWLYPDCVRIVAGRYESKHARAPGHDHDTTHSERRAARPIAGTFRAEKVRHLSFTWETEVE